MNWGVGRELDGGWLVVWVTGGLPDGGEVTLYVHHVEVWDAEVAVRLALLHLVVLQRRPLRERVDAEHLPTATPPPSVTPRYAPLRPVTPRYAPLRPVTPRHTTSGVQQRTG